MRRDPCTPDSRVQALPCVSSQRSFEGGAGIDGLRARPFLAIPLVLLAIPWSVGLFARALDCFGAYAEWAFRIASGGL